MINPWLFALPLVLTGCAGTATYTVKPFVDPTTGTMACCEAAVTSSKDVGSVHVHATRQANGDYDLTLEETGVSASEPIKAQALQTQSISNAVSNTAAAIVKVTP